MYLSLLSGKMALSAGSEKPEKLGTRKVNMVEKLFFNIDRNLGPKQEQILRKPQLD